MMTRPTLTEKVKINNQEFEIQLLPSTLQTDNTTTTPKPVVRAQDLTKVVRQVPSVTQLPRWEDGTDARLQRISYELALCAVGYSTTKPTKRVGWGYLSSGVIWVIIYDFPLPPGYNYRTTDVMILLPPNYPQTPPDWFYVDQNLRLANGERPPHVFYDDTSYDPNRGIYGEAPPHMVGWTACCLHIREWRPKANPAEGHSLLSVCELIGKAFERWKR